MNRNPIAQCYRDLTNSTIEYPWWWIRSEPEQKENQNHRIKIHFSRKQRFWIDTCKKMNIQQEAKEYLGKVSPRKPEWNNHSKKYILIETRNNHSKKKIWIIAQKNISNKFEYCISEKIEYSQNCGIYFEYIASLKRLKYSQKCYECDREKLEIRQNKSSLMRLKKKKMEQSKTCRRASLNPLRIALRQLPLLPICLVQLLSILLVSTQITKPWTCFSSSLVVKREDAYNFQVGLCPQQHTLYHPGDLEPLTIPETEDQK